MRRYLLFWGLFLLAACGNESGPTGIPGPAHDRREPIGESEVAQRAHGRARLLREGQMWLNQAEPAKLSLLAVKRGELSWAEVDIWRKDLHHDFECALAETKLPKGPITKQPFASSSKGGGKWRTTDEHL